MAITTVDTAAKTFTLIVQNSPVDGAQSLFDSIIAYLWGVFTTPIAIGNGQIQLITIILLFLLLVPATFISKFLQQKIVRRIVTRFGKLDPATEFIVLKVTHYVIMVMTFFVILSTIGFDFASLAVLFGLLMVGIGFGLQDLTANFLSGVIILFERPIKVGDWVMINDMEGEVKEISLRASHIETNDAVHIIVPNKEVLSNNILNNSLGAPYMRVHTSVGVSYNSDMSLVQKVLLDVAKSHSTVLSNPEPEIWLVGFGDSSVDFEVLTWIRTPRERLRTQADLYLKSWWALKEAGIEIPFPQRDLHIRSTDIPLPFRGEVVDGRPPQSEAGEQPA